MKHIVILTALLTASTAVQAQEFDFHGAELGMAFEDFQALPPLNGRVLRDGTPTWCHPPSNPNAAKAGDVECMRAGDNPFGEIPGIPPANVTYHFKKTVDSSTRLSLIIIMGNRSYTPLAMTGLQAKWGKGRQNNTSATNGLGQAIPQTTVTWAKTNSEIELQSPCANVKYMCITYTHKSLPVARTGNDPSSGSGF